MKSSTEVLKGRQEEKVFEFVNFYKSAAETNVKLVKRESLTNNVNKENSFLSNSHGEGVKGRSKTIKSRNTTNNSVPLDISTVDNAKSSLDDSKITSTPKTNRKSQGSDKFKSIMKNSTADQGEPIETYNETYQRKKRNKSVSFRLEDNEEVALKKTKQDEQTKKKKELKSTEENDLIKEFKKNKKAKKFEKNIIKNDNKVHGDMEILNTETTEVLPGKKHKKKKNKSVDIIHDSPPEAEVSAALNEETKNKLEKNKKIKPESSQETGNQENQPETNPEAKEKKNKKKKRKSKRSQSESEGEPLHKSSKKELKPEKIAESLENLKIGDNPHTLTDLLDEMTVVDKNKQKKNNKNKKKENCGKTISPSSSEVTELEKIDEGKEKVKWRKRKWNKDKKGEVDDDGVATSVVVENLPISIMCNYKKLLTERFGDFGTIKKIGIAEVYPTEEPRPVFTTTIVFDSEDAATKALEEDNTRLGDARLRISRPLPAPLTTLVVSSYAELSDQTLSSVFTSAGRIRSIRHLMKGRKSKATSFIEFHNTEALERALKMAEDAKIGGKKIYLARFEVRSRKGNLDVSPAAKDDQH